MVNKEYVFLFYLKKKKKSGGREPSEHFDSGTDVKCRPLK